MEWRDRNLFLKFNNLCLTMYHCISVFKGSRLFFAVGAIWREMSGGAFYAQQLGRRGKLNFRTDGATNASRKPLRCNM